MRIPDAQRLGEVGAGWKVALTTLMHERLAIGTLGGPDFQDVLELARHLKIGDAPATKDANVRSHLADWYVQSKGLEYTKLRTLTALSRGQMPGPESSIYKVVSARKLQDIANFALDMMDSAGLATDPETAPMRAMFQHAFALLPRRADCRRHGRNPAEHHRRAGAWPARRHTGGPRPALCRRRYKLINQLNNRRRE